MNLGCPMIGILAGGVKHLDKIVNDYPKHRIIMLYKDTDNVDVGNVGCEIGGYNNFVDLERVIFNNNIDIILYDKDNNERLPSNCFSSKIDSEKPIHEILIEITNTECDFNLVCGKYFSARYYSEWMDVFLSVEGLVCRHLIVDGIIQIPKQLVLNDLFGDPKYGSYKYLIIIINEQHYVISETRDRDIVIPI